MKYNNSYFVLRHGESRANVRKVLQSSLEDGKRKSNGLTDKGKKQVEDSVQEILARGVLNDKTMIVASPFSRAVESAQVAKVILGVAGIVIEEDLRERFFGKLDGEKTVVYDNVWKMDKLNEVNKESGVESQDAVLVRMLKVIKKLEKNYQGENILLVSHGDPIDILRTFFNDQPLSKHSVNEKIKNAEIIKLD